MGTVTLKGSEYTYYVTTPASYTATPENLSNYLWHDFMPKITRNKTGDAFTRYFDFYTENATGMFVIGGYKAVFSKTSKTATVSRYNPGGRIEWYGDLATEYMLGSFYTRLYVGASTSSEVFDTKSISCPFNVSGFDPEFDTNELNIESDIPSEFGYVIGHCSAEYSVAHNSAWPYIIGESELAVSSPADITLKVGDVTVFRTAPPRWKVVANNDNINSTRLEIEATVITKLNGSGRWYEEISIQPYSPPTLSSLKMTRIPLRGSTGVRIDASYALNSLNKESTETDEITTGYIRLKWYTTDENGDPVEGSLLNPNTYLICNDGDPLDSITGTCQIPSRTPYDNESSYTVHAWIEDRLGGKSDILRYTMPTEFRTIDVYPGGRGIAFGAVADDEGFYCAMPASFDDLEVRGPLSGVNGEFSENLSSEDLLLSLDTTDPPDTTTTDGQIFKALQDLGWDSDVIV